MSRRGKENLGFASNSCPKVWVFYITSFDITGIKCRLMISFCINIKINRPPAKNRIYLLLNGTKGELFFFLYCFLDR